jgi:uncharacterized protein
MNNVTTDQFAVVTGASSGIGLELAKQFAAHGFDLLIAAESDDLDNAASVLRALGVRVDTIQVDLAQFDGVEELYDRMLAMGRPIDAMAINAGVGVGGPFLMTDLEDELNLIDLNVISVVHLAKLALPDMVARGQGRVLFTASIAAEMPGPFEAVYAASKAFVLSLSEALRNELKDTGVTVTTLQPGATDTNFFHRAGMDDTKVGKGAKDDPAEVARQGFEALMAGKDHVVAGSFKNKVESTIAQILPETTKAAMHRKLAEPESPNP